MEWKYRCWNNETDKEYKGIAVAGNVFDAIDDIEKSLEQAGEDLNNIFLDYCEPN